MDLDKGANNGVFLWGALSEKQGVSDLHMWVKLRPVGDALIRTGRPGGMLEAAVYAGPKALLTSIEKGFQEEEFLVFPLALKGWCYQLQCSKWLFSGQSLFCILAICPQFPR